MDTVLDNTVHREWPPSWPKLYCLFPEQKGSSVSRVLSLRKRVVNMYVYRATCREGRGSQIHGFMPGHPSGRCLPLPEDTTLEPALSQ